MNFNDFPKIIWFLWLQGLDNAPSVVKSCFDSWRVNNPDWQLILLNEKNLSGYVKLKNTRITNQALSDIVRINLLAAQGGVWVDATCFCTKPLKDWLYPNLTTGFFAFDKPAPDRMLSSWFMASTPGNYITTGYQKAVNNYWEVNPGLVSFENSSWHFLNNYLQRKKTSVWFGPFVTRILKVYPYFWFHYLFEYCCLSDNRFRQQWDQTPKISADIPHKLQFDGLLNPVTTEIKAEIDQKSAPVYKLTWKYNEADFKEGCILDYLVNAAGH